MSSYCTESTAKGLGNYAYKENVTSNVKHKMQAMQKGLRNPLPLRKEALMK